MYVTLQESQESQSEIPNDDRLENWTLTCDQGYDINAVVGVLNTVSFKSYYKGEQKFNKFNLTCDDTEMQITRIDDYSFNLQCASVKNVKVTLSLYDSPQITQEFDVSVLEKQADWIAIYGPKKIRVLESVVFTVKSDFDFKDVIIKSQNGLFSVSDIVDGKVTITGKAIGQDYIIMSYGSYNFTTPLEIISIWM
jgi:hypothetical protein